MINFTKKLFTQAKKHQKTIVLTEGEDLRIIEAAHLITQKKIAKIILLGNKDIILNNFKKFNINNLKNINIIDPKNCSESDSLSERLFELRKEKGLTKEAANELIKSPYYFGTMLVKEGIADGLIGGAVCPTADVFKPALQIIKASPDQKLVSTFFIMIIKHEILFFADCSLNINPNKEELANIAIQTADSFKSFTNKEAKVSMLSFSTKGSAFGELVDKVKEATLIAKKLRPDLLIEGEVQADAALIPHVSQQKDSDSQIKGTSNVLIFPDLNSGNISYKLVQKLANAKAFGPVTQGLNKPINDLSRSCSVEDIIINTAITAIQAAN
ncbi:MAG: phosphate acetyltransferase [Candidatus Shapirobacteria bacterium]